uniref:MFS transporter n=1 Tax=Leptospirillum ferriphilum TaxID=178606 RepID=A0A7C3R2S0_9BACT
MNANKNGSAHLTGRNHPLTRAFGLTSLFADFSYEMAHVILPLWLLHLGGEALTLSVLEIFSEFFRIAGSVAARWRGNWLSAGGRIRLGYTLSMLASPLMGLATAPWHLIVLKSLSWFGKGLRGPSRDAVLSTLLPAPLLSSSFATIRALDQTGGILGPLAAVLLLGVVSSPEILWMTALPGMICLWFVIRATRLAGEMSSEEPGRPVSSGLMAGDPPDRRLLLFLSSHFLIRMGLFPATLLMFEFGKNTGLDHLMGIGFIMASLAHVGAAMFLSESRKGSPWQLVTTGAVLLAIALSGLAVGNNRTGFYLAGMILWGVSEVLVTVGSKSLVPLLSGESRRLDAYVWLEISGAGGMLALQPFVSRLWDRGDTSAGFWMAAGATGIGILLLAVARSMPDRQR